MKVKTYLTDKEGLEITLNEIGYEKVLNIIPCVEYDTTLFMVICDAERIKEKNEERRKNISENVETVCIGERLKATGERFGIRDCVCELIDYAEEIGFSERQLFEWQGTIDGRKIDKE